MKDVVHLMVLKFTQLNVILLKKKKNELIFKNLFSTSSGRISKANPRYNRLNRSIYPRNNISIY